MSDYPSNKPNNHSPTESIDDISPSVEELSDLDSFCESFEFDDISFEHWADINQSLDLIISRTVSKQELEQGGKLEVSFSRKIKEISQNRQKVSKMSVKRTVEWNPSKKNEIRLVFQREGDFDCEKRGNLIIHLQVKTNV